MVSLTYTRTQFVTRKIKDVLFVSFAELINENFDGYYINMQEYK